MSSTLAPYELFKHDYRLQTFLDKYKNKEPFMLVSGARVYIKFDPMIYLKLKNKDRIFAQNVLFEDARSNITKRYRLSQFKKTEEFGGKDMAAGKVYEENQVGEINQQLGKIMRESGTDYIKLSFKNKIYNINHCEQAPEGAKADLHFTSPAGAQVFWMSYKRGAAPRDINQWSGVSAYAEHPETLAFVDKVRDLCSLNGGSIWPAVTFARKISDIDLMRNAVYGDAYNKIGAYSRNNVSIVLQGRVTLIKTGRLWRLSANKVIENGDAFKGEHSSYMPVFMATYKGQDRNQFGIKNARFMIHPMMGRAVTQWV